MMRTMIDIKVGDILTGSSVLVGKLKHIVTQFFNKYNHFGKKDIKAKGTIWIVAKDLKWKTKTSFPLWHQNIHRILLLLP